MKEFFDGGWLLLVVILEIADPGNGGPESLVIVKHHSILILGHV